MPNETPAQDPNATPTPDPSTDVLAQLATTLTTLTQRMETLETALKPAEPKKEVAAPAPTPAPVPPSGRPNSAETEKYLADLRVYAAHQTQEAARFRIAREAGIDPEDLQGDYADEAAMRAAATQQAKLKRLEQLTQETQKKLEELSKAPTTIDEQPVGDTGGSTGKKLTPEQELDKLYEGAKQTRDVGAYLTTLYQDRRKVLGIGPAPVPET